MYQDNILSVLQPNELIILKRNLLNIYPKSVYTLYFIENYLNWLKKSKTVIVKFFTINNKRFNTFIGYLADQNNMLTFSILNNPNDFNELFKCDLINWKSGPTFEAVQAEQVDSIRECCRKYGYEIEYDVPTIVHFLSNADALMLNIVLPMGVHLKSLTINDAEFINTNWPCCFDGSEKLIRNIIEYNGGLCLIDNQTGIMVAWAIINNFGAIGIVQTLPEHRRKGYGMAITLALCQKIAKQGMDVCTMTTVGNSSIKLMEKIGFYEVSRVSWLKLKSSD